MVAWVKLVDCVFGGVDRAAGAGVVAEAGTCGVAACGVYCGFELAGQGCLEIGEPLAVRGSQAVSPASRSG